MGFIPIIMKYIILIIYLSAFQIASIFGQPLPVGTTFYGVYGNSIEGQLNSIVQTPDNGFIATGKSTQMITTTHLIDSLLIVKTDYKGALQWSKSISGFANSEGLKIIKTVDNNYLVLGFGRYSILDSVHGFLIKIDIIGNVLWVKNYLTNSNSYPRGICRSSDGGFRIIMNNQNLQNNSYNACIINTDSLGIIQESNKINMPELSAAKTITETSDGGYLVAIDTGNFYQNTGNSFVLKFDSFGNMLWTKMIDSGYTESNRALIETSDNSILVGFETYIPFQWENYILMKLDNNGNFIWVKEYNEWTNFVSISEGTDGNYYTGTGLLSASDFYLTKIDVTGNLIWRKEFGFTNQYFWLNPYSCLLTNDGGFVFTGNSNKTTQGGHANYGFIIKTDSIGLIPCFNNDQPLDTVNTFTYTVTDATLNFTPETWSVNNVISLINKQISTILYCQQVGIKEIQESNPAIIYPNPFTTYTTIAFSGEQKNISIKIMDVLGKEIKAYNFTGKELVIERNEMNTGIYFVQVIDDKKNVINKKIVIQ